MSLFIPFGSIVLRQKVLVSMTKFLAEFPIFHPLILIDFIYDGKRAGKSDGNFEELIKFIPDILSPDKNFFPVSYPPGLFLNQ